MQLDDREQFDALMKQLCAGFNVPVGDRGDAYFLGLKHMDLAMFAHVVEDVLGEGGPDRIPNVSSCWAISKKLRSRRSYDVTPAPAKPAWSGDNWDRAANFHLLDYLRTHATSGPSTCRYGHSTYSQRGVEPSLEMKERIDVLVQAKKTWALEMREGGPAERDPVYQKRFWNDLMIAAEARIDELIAADTAVAA